MTKLTTTEVKHVAKLAKLELKANEVGKFRNQLSSIINYITQLSEVDVDNIKPTSQTTNLFNIYRNDETGSQDNLTQSQALSGKDDVNNGYFKIPRILEEES